MSKTSNEYHRKYNLERYHRIRQESFVILGGKCARCDCIPTDFILDHKDPATKTFDISSGFARSKKDYDSELMKCQILCLKCNSSKTIEERGQKDARITHGTLSSYKYCKCVLCRAAKSEWMRNYNLRRKHATVSDTV